MYVATGLFVHKYIDYHCRLQDNTCMTSKQCMTGYSTSYIFIEE